MPFEDDRALLNAMSAALSERWHRSTDPAEKQALLEQINRIEDSLDSLAVLGSQGAAAAVNRASADLQALIATGQVNPFDHAIRAAFGAAADAAIAAADAASRAFVAHEFRAAPRDEPETPPDFTPAPVASAPAIPIPAPSPAPIAIDGALPPIVAGTKLAQLTEDYTRCWAACRINDAKRAEVEAAADRLLKGRARYVTVSGRTNRVPWQLIGIMHGLECGYDFFKHLHNGDSLAEPTHRVPAGRPIGWSGAGSWEESAVDAVRLKKLDRVGAWALPQVLYSLESFNGFGYRPHRIRSPYLWSFSNLYTCGRFVADHDFRPDAVSKQVGAALVLKVLEQRGLWP